MFVLDYISMVFETLRTTLQCNIMMVGTIKKGKVTT